MTMAEMSGASAGREALKALLEARVGSSEPAAWLASHVGVEIDAVRKALSLSARVVGRRSLVGTFSERAGATVPGVWGPVSVGHWRTDGAARAFLVAEAASRTETPFATLFELYDLGDTDTRVACLRALNFVNDGATEQAMALVNDAGRTYLNPLLEAAWCRNPFSEVHLDDEQYRKAVLKALFCEVSVEGFVNLEARANQALAQSLCEYADEREAAGRTVPAAVWVVSALHPRAGLVARLIGRLEHPLPAERGVAARALANAKDLRAVPFMEERLSREEDVEVQGFLKAALARINS